ncbi:MAG: hypothetical protein ABII68_03015, partial [Pseudomonadota bacterium]
MKKSKHGIHGRTLRILTQFILIFFPLVFGIPESSAAEISRVAVVPFTINAEKDLTFLRDGIADMLT